MDLVDSSLAKRLNQSAPAQWGVYSLFHEGRWVYFGESGNIRDRLTQHINNETNPCITRSNPPFFAYELVAGEAQRKARQDVLIREFWHQGLCNQRLG